VPGNGLPRVAWGSVIAGVMLSLIVYWLISVLRIAIAASRLSPLSQPHPLHGFDFGSGIWVILTTVVAVFVGSYFAGRCASTRMLHVYSRGRSWSCWLPME
jgi:hypothetical protein